MKGFRCPTHVVIEEGSLDSVPELLLERGLQSVGLVTDQGIAQTEACARLQARLAESRLDVMLFDAVEPNPRTKTVRALADRLRERSTSAVVGLGGGSVLDAAKAAAMLARNEGAPENYVGPNRYTETPLPFFAIPTTCGTGSEVTWVSVLSDEAESRKISIKGESMFADMAIVDAELLRTLPPSLVATTGIDALTHALEATTCRAANPVSDALAEQSIELIFAFLPRAARDIEGDREARAEIMRASTLAGLAFGNADVAAVHCLSESLGGLFDVPHGLANAVLIHPVFRFLLPAVEGRLADLDARLERRDRGASAEHFLERLEGLLERTGIPGYASLGIPADQNLRIARMAVENGSNPSCPMSMGQEQYLQVLAQLD